MTIQDHSKAAQLQQIEERSIDRSSSKKESCFQDKLSQSHEVLTVTIPAEHLLLFHAEAKELGHTSSFQYSHTTIIPLGQDYCTDK